MITETVFSVLFEKLTSATLERLAGQNGIDSDIKKWKMSLLQIRDVLNDASQKEIRVDSVKRWLNRLHHLEYDIDDVLDAVETEAIHREFADDEPETFFAKLRKTASSCFSKFSLTTSVTKDKLDDITTKLQHLVDEISALGLIVKDEVRPNNINRSRYQNSILIEPSIVGRKDEKADLLQKLLVMGDEPSGQNFSIVPIVGMGGVGKTTLARLLYNENQVVEHFERKAWVCVSDNFDSFAISKVIYESVTGENREFADLNLLQVALRDHLRDKRFLLVLDDVWSESCDDWETLVGPIYACARGTKIIMTTRKEQLLRALGYDRLNQLSCLSLDDALSLFAQHALGVNNFNLHTTLRPPGEAIAKKCDGLPLALKALGRLLRKKHDEEDWKEVLESEIWRLKYDCGIVPALRLSYHDLSPCLKRLFAYCSSFPKDYMFDRENLVLLWMAEGLLRQSLPTDSTEERLGHEYFEELLSRSFFQHAPNASFFVMHDLMNDLATSVAGEFFLRLDNDIKDTGKEVLGKCRHLSFVRERYITYKKLEGVSSAKSLRTFMATSVGLAQSSPDFYLSNKILVDLLPQLSLLRVLSLSNFYIKEVPDSIGEMRNLRYLNLSRTSITHLPESVSNLYNLQVLIVYNCSKLAKLPNSFSKLRNLRHFDLRNTCVNKLPLGIGELNNLQTLSKIFIEGENGFEITELKGLKNLCGKISIEGLEEVQNPNHVREANFSQKRLSELEVKWSEVFDVSRNEMVEKEVLNELKPFHESLKRLKVVSYGGTNLPNWVGDPSFLRLKHVSIRRCKRCLSLPSLGQLPALKELFISHMDVVKVVGFEFFGTGGTFPSLKILKIENMPGWEVWSANSGVVFPCLKELHIQFCPKLAEVSLEALPSLRVLEVSYCGDGVLRSLVKVASSATKLAISGISGLTDDVWRGVTEYIGTVEELSIYLCNEIRYLWESESQASKVFVKLRKLYVSSCNNLVSLGKKEEDGHCTSNLHLPSLRRLVISHCKNMECCTVPNSIESLSSNLHLTSLMISSCKNMERSTISNSIESLSITNCESLTKISFTSGGGQKLKSVSIWGCGKVMKTELGGYVEGDGDTSMMLFTNGSSMLDSLFIDYMSNLKSIIKLNCFLHLTNLRIYNCLSLETFPDDQLLDLVSLKDMYIRNCPRLDATFPRGRWPPKLCKLEIGGLKKPISQWGPQNFPLSLVNLFLYGGSSSEDVIDFSQLSHHLLPSSLTRLQINDFKKLESVSKGLQHLTSLQHLSLSNCRKMKHLPEMLFPSLLSLDIFNCPELKERCSKNGPYWPLISHIPCICNF